MTNHEIQIAAFERVNKLFEVAPAETRIPVPELHDRVIFGNTRSGVVLDEVAVDKDGRLWRHDRTTDELVMFFDPSTCEKAQS